MNKEINIVLRSAVKTETTLTIVEEYVSSNRQFKQNKDRIIKFVKRLKQSERIDLDCKCAIFGLLLSKQEYKFLKHLELNYGNEKCFKLFLNHPDHNIYSRKSKIQNCILLYLAYLYYQNKNIKPIHKELRKRLNIILELPQFKEIIQNKPILEAI